MIHIACPHCLRLLQAADAQSGNFIPCPGCKQLVPLPGQGQGGKSLKSLWGIAYAGVACAILALVAVFGWGYFGNDFKVTTVQMKIREITQACKLFAFEHNDQYPASLEVLITQDDSGRGPYLKSETIFDPWGKLFQYEPNPVPRGNIIYPDVYCILPDGRTIGNWGTKGK